jgi:hypothetical protein
VAWAAVGKVTVVREAVAMALESSGTVVAEAMVKVTVAKVVAGVTALAKLATEVEVATAAQGRAGRHSRCNRCQGCKRCILHQTRHRRSRYLPHSCTHQCTEAWCPAATGPGMGRVSSGPARPGLEAVAEPAAPPLARDEGRSRCNRSRSCILYILRRAHHRRSRRHSRNCSPLHRSTRSARIGIRRRA